MARGRDRLPRPDVLRLRADYSAPPPPADIDAGQPKLAALQHAPELAAGLTYVNDRVPPFRQCCIGSGGICQETAEGVKHDEKAIMGLGRKL